MTTLQRPPEAIETTEAVETTQAVETTVAVGAVEAVHAPLLGIVLSSHRTAGGTTEYVRCSCGGFVVLDTPRGGSRRQVSHAGR